MAVYRILEVTKVGTSKDGQKNYKKCTLETPEGTELKDVTFWDWKMKDMWDRVSPNMSIEGSVEIDPKWGAGFEPQFNTYSKAPRYGKTQAVTAAMERKEQSIEKFQGSKELGIKVSSTARDATLILTALMGNGKTAEWKKPWLEIRKWLWDNFENVSNDNYPYPENNAVPFD